jgi:putative DNA primase/helicase
VQSEGETAGEDEKAALLALVEALSERAKKLRSLGRINNVLALASDAGLLGIDGDMWDRGPWLLGVANGVLDLRTGQLRDGQPEDFIRLVTPTLWQGLGAPCPRFERFVSEVMSDEPERVGFLQRLLGYSINGTTREHILALLVGHRGRNGKRALMETIQHALGDYAGTVSTDVLIGQERWRSAGSAQPHLMDLVGKRLAICSETGEHDQLAAATVKNITGGDEIRARRLHENLLSFRPSHTLFLQTNRKPQAPADDDALWERVKVIEFKVRFVDEPSAPDERPRDHMLEAALRDEAPGILAWLVRGHLDWLQDGLRTPESVKLARDSYRKGESIEPFLDACCEEWDSGQAEAGALYTAYEQWCDAEELKPKTQHWFGRQVAARFEKGRTSGGRTCYFGLSVVAAPERRAHDSGTRKGSESIETSRSGSGTNHFATVAEPFPPCSKSSEVSSTHEANPMEQGSKGSEGSALDDTLQPDSPTVTVMRQRNGTYLVTDWRPGAPRNGLLVFAEESEAQAYVAAASGQAREDA